MFNPNQINISRPFMGSVWQNSETETIARNVVVIQQKLDGTKWTPFTWEQYKAGCSHNVTVAEREVLEALVHGGRPATFTSAILQPGYLTKDADGKYSVTEKFVDVLPKIAQAK